MFLTNAFLQGNSKEKGPIGGTNAQSKQCKLFLFGWVVDAAICSAVKPDAQQDWDLTNLLMHICLVALVAGARQTD